MERLKLNFTPTASIEACDGLTVPHHQPGNYPNC